tara:strand:+ start:174 stop:947 length:774 start_codon:yes stop_codon:yes gene_type:complete
MIKKESATKLRQGGEKYTVIPSKTISAVDCADSMALLIYLLDKSENWIVRHADIRNKFTWGQKRCQNSINKLKSFGLLETVDVRNDKGHLLGKEIIVYSSPNVPLTDNRSDGISVGRNIGLGDTLTNNQSLPNNQEITNNQLLPSVKKFCPVHFASYEYQGFELNLESWTEWCEFRKDNKKPIIKTTATKQLKMLVNHSADEQKEIIDKSIIGQYQGLFPPKNQTQPRYASKQSVAIDNNNTDWMNTQSFSDTLEDL